MGADYSIANQPIILFDGVCNLCNGTVVWIIRHDKKAVYKFSALQSEFAQAQLKAINTSTQVDSIVLIQNGAVLYKSDAALAIAGQLSGLWPIVKIGKILPRFIRNGVYDFIARHRYRLFGRTDQCQLPTPELMARFVS
jgi:predicted DCC family thiol-disulfide oxidoreductase YuxK